MCFYRKYWAIIAILTILIISSCSVKDNKGQGHIESVPASSSRAIQPAFIPSVVQGLSVPEPRSKKEVERVVASLRPNSARKSESPFRIVLCASEKDPGHSDPGFHDYPIWRSRWASILGEIEGVEIDTADQWPDSEQVAYADVVVFFHDNPVWSVEKAEDLDALLSRGAGLVFLHWSINCRRDTLLLQERIGLVWSKDNKWRRGALNLNYQPHPVTLGFEGSEGFVEEPYWNLNGDPSTIQVLATSEEEGRPRPQLWTKQNSNGRVFVCLPGHFTWTHDDPLYRLLVFRGICWAAQRPLNSLDDGVFVGARFQ